MKPSDKAIEVAARAICFDRPFPACKCKENFGCCTAPVQNLKNGYWSAAEAAAKAVYDSDFEALRAENARLVKERDEYKTWMRDSQNRFMKSDMENARLREALKRLYHASENISEDVRMTSDEVFRWHNELRAARAAMGESDDLL